jgi:uncharacterized membrane protein YdjX (TVP38/TMEM64 family)
LGTFLVWISSIASATLAYLIARYFARDAIERRIARNPKFRALDDAIGKKGWRIVALLRLNPMVPFSFSNYIYGLTRIKFWQYIVASAVGMLPCTFMYVYLGHAGRLAFGGDRPMDARSYALLALGFVLTVSVIFYVKRMAKKSLAQGITPVREP